MKRIPVAYLLFLFIFVFQRQICSSVIASSVTTNNDSDPLSTPFNRNAFQNSIAKIANIIRVFKLLIVRWFQSILPWSNDGFIPGENGTETQQYAPSISGWGGIPITAKERECLADIRNTKIPNNTENSKWLDEVTDAELLRFVRRKGNIQDAWKMITAHAAWRKTDRGADSTKYDYSTSNLRYEIYWMDTMDKAGCPTLVVRTQVHDGIDYNEDAKIFTGFMVSALEEGKRRFGVGTERQMCLILDRGGTVVRAGKKKIEKRDFSAIPNLVILFRHLFTTLNDNYPEMLDAARIVPASRFFSMCYKITGRIMDKANRDKFKMVREGDLNKVLGPLWSKSDLPPHLGGSSVTYKSQVTIP